MEQEQKEQIELFYRRGVSHGFAVATEAFFKRIDGEFAMLRRDIEEWKNDLDNENGIPSIPFENISMSIV